VVTAQSNKHFIDPFDVVFSVFVEDWFLLGSANSEDASLWLIDDTCELFDTEHTQVGDCESTSLVFLWGEFIFLSSGNQVLGVFGNFTESLLVGKRNDWSNKTIFDSNGKGNINILELSNEVTIPLGVNFWNIFASKRSSLDDEIVNGDFNITGFVDLGSQRKESVHLDSDSFIVMWYLLFALS